MVSENRRCFQILSVTEPESASTQGIPPRAGSDNIAASCGRGRAVNSESVERCVGQMSRRMPLILLLAWNLAGAQPAPAPVVVEQVVLASALDQLALTGTATARRTSSISPYSEGLVIDMRVEDCVGEVRLVEKWSCGQCGTPCSSWNRECAATEDLPRIELFMTVLPRRARREGSSRP